MTHGDGEVVTRANQYAVWDWLIYRLAGIFAEARHRKVSAAAVRLTSGRDDANGARSDIGFLVANGYAESEEDAWRRAEDETRQFVRGNWATIERVAVALAVRGVLSASDLDALITIA